MFEFVIVFEKDKYARHIDHIAHKDKNMSEHTKA